MRHILALVLILGVSLTYSFSQDLRVTCEIESDTVSFSEPLFIRVLLENTSKNKIKLPQGFHVTSNFLPNGLDFPQEGIELYFEISPNTPEAKVFIEGLTVIEPTKFYVIKPGMAKEFHVDINKHLIYIQKFLKEENIEIPRNIIYSITCRVSNSLYFLDKERSSTRFEKVQSLPVRVYVSQ